MKKWVGFTVILICTLSTSVRADDVLVEATQEESPQETLAETPVMAAPPATAPEEQAPKQVGKASVDSTNTARASTAAKYILAASAIIIGVVAIILVSRNQGHHRHSRSH